MVRRIVAICGQSNERGRWVHQTVGGAFLQTPGGTMHGDPLPPNAGTDGSMWPVVMHDLWLRDKRNVFKVRNTAVGGTSIVADWCGTDGSVPFSDADGGWDPNGYIATIATELGIGDFDERWLFVSIGQGDANAGTTAANFALAHVNIANHFLVKGRRYRVAIGFTNLGSGSQSQYPDELDPGIASVLSTFADESRVIAGANLYARFGATLNTTDGSHMDSRSYTRAAGAWVDALIAGGW